MPDVADSTSKWPTIAEIRSKTQMRVSLVSRWLHSIDLKCTPIRGAWHNRFAHIGLWRSATFQSLSYSYAKNNGLREAASGI
jgi:hypothetical protein